MTERPLPLALRPLDAIGRWAIAVVEALGRFGTFLGQALGTILTPPFKFWAFVDRIHYIGYRSLLIILLTGGFTGIGVGLPVYFTLVRLAVEAYLRAAVALSLIPGVRPVLAA